MLERCQQEEQAVSLSRLLTDLLSSVVGQIEQCATPQTATVFFVG